MMEKGGKTPNLQTGGEEEKKDKEQSIKNFL